MSPLAVAQEQHLETVMRMIVKGINDKAGVAVVRLQFLVSGSCRETYLGPERVKENFDYVRTRVMCKTRMCAVSSTLQEKLERRWVIGSGDCPG
jgi:hypothetical protein